MVIERAKPKTDYRALLEISEGPRPQPFITNVQIGDFLILIANGEGVAHIVGIGIRMRDSERNGSHEKGGNERSENPVLAPEIQVRKDCQYTQQRTSAIGGEQH